MKIFITGITGMIGGEVARLARSQGHEVYGIARSSATSRMAVVEEENVLRCDILDRDALERLIARIKPDLVVHMAAQAYNGISWDMEDMTHLTNYTGTLNVLRACKLHAPQSKVLLACSSAAYGDVKPEDTPLVEERLLKPMTPYGVSKAATEALGYQYWKNFGLKVFLPRLFIHVGTGHPPATAIQNFARQLALISRGLLPPTVRVGNLTSARDFVDVRDGARALMLLAEKGDPGDPINICTGKAHTIGDLLEMLIQASGLDVEVLPDPQLMRPSDEPLLLGDNSKLKKLGWSPDYTMRETLSTVYQDWLTRI
ncbi:GDP-mannose 4,6-dehydratase [Luteolibacter yonseiensis]|uniref:GDP-mannose 4,6-dehydratase n=1 Tax=Luteolibacter yonseiensis TaxID=1144680 RepID=A0A934R4F2_9BACT|nr:GDP-mannose 4,6-dehydratase [Luteolibacter yonseiensis]MBK1815280.1 GDP-mannose 4,6-dehydratase [Luteolibacter yonseiensis]